MENFTFEGKIRKRRKYVEYKNACLPSIENKLLFILTYLKGNDLQDRSAEMFGISQPKANVWIHLLHRMLNQALNEIDVLPDRYADSLEKKLDKLAEEIATTDTTGVEATKRIAETFEPTVEVEATELPAETFGPTVEVEATELETFGLTVEAEATELPAETLRPTVEVEATELPAETFGPTVEAEATELPAETFRPTVEAEATELEAETFDPTVEVEATELKTFEPTVEATPLVAETLETSDEVETMVDIDRHRNDGFERPINRERYEAIQEIFYSGKQKRHTVKNVLLTDVSCYVLFLSDTCEGKKHDKKVADEAGYSLPEGSYLGQDTGWKAIEILGVNKVQPKKKPRGGELTIEPKEQNRIISRVRVRVEHAIGFVTRCRIVKDTLRNWKNGFRDKVIETCCGLHNFRLQFRPWHYKTAVI